jgi:hypothetical protein
MRGLLFAMTMLLGCGDDSGPSGMLDADRPRTDGGSMVRRDANEPLSDSGPPGSLLRDRYPGDVGLAADPAVLFFDDFEDGWGRWDAPSADTDHLFIESDGTAHAGERHLRSTVTHAQLIEDEYISSSPRVEFPRRVPEMYWRLYARFAGIAPNPHHWIRVSAGTEAFSSSGLANTVPDGDQGFWFDFDADTINTFNFYVYWYRMRSGRCNDGTAVPGCDGDQGTTYYYGNVFEPPAEENRFTPDEWTCVEFGARANTVGESDGAVMAWVNDVPIGEFSPGMPVGTWLRSTFHPAAASSARAPIRCRSRASTSGARTTCSSKRSSSTRTTSAARGKHAVTRWSTWASRSARSRRSTTTTSSSPRSASAAADDV